MTAKGTGLRPAIIETLSKTSDGLTTAQIAERLSTTPKYARGMLATLGEEGVVKAYRRGPEKVYSLAQSNA